MNIELDNCGFTAAAAGLGDFTFGSAFGTCVTPDVAGAVSGFKYNYLAMNDADQGEWEKGIGLYSGASNLARTTVGETSAPDGISKIDFTAPPRVHVSTIVTIPSFAQKVLYDGTAAAVANLTLDIDPAHIGIFKGFLLYLFEVKPVTNHVDLDLRMGDSGGIDSGSSDYKSIINYSDETFSSTTPPSVFVGTSSNIVLAGSIDSTKDYNLFAQISTNDPAATGLNSVYFEATGAGNPNIAWTSVIGWRQTHIAMTTLQLRMSSGNIASMRYQLLGVPGVL